MRTMISLFVRWHQRMSQVLLGGSSTWPTPLDEYSSHIPGGDKNLSPLWMDKLEDGSASANQSVFGSLTFNVGDGKFKAPSAEENTSIGRNAAPRAKVPFDKGYSHMDWLKLTRTHTDLAGLKGSSNRRLVSMDEVNSTRWKVLCGLS